MVTVSEIRVLLSEYRGDSSSMFAMLNVEQITRTFFYFRNDANFLNLWYVRALEIHLFRCFLSRKLADQKEREADEAPGVEESEAEYCTLASPLDGPKKDNVEGAENKAENANAVADCEPFYDSVPAEDSDGECKSHLREGAGWSNGCKTIFGILAKNLSGERKF